MTDSIKNIVIFVLVVLCVFLGYQYIGKPSGGGGGLASQEAVDTALAFINSQMLQPGIEASLVGAVDDVKKGSIYEFGIKVLDEEFTAYITQDGKTFFPQGIDIEEVMTEDPIKEIGATISNFSVNEEEICMEDGLPIIYFFGSESCPFCQWEHPIMEEVAEQFEGLISFHNNMDTEDDRDVFEQYSTGGIPTLVFGCKYSRVGAGKNLGEEVETDNLTALICDLTGGMPAEVCESVSDLIEQINL